jgi:hypothetical protein
MASSGGLRIGATVRGSALSRAINYFECAYEDHPQYAELKREAARQGRTMSELIETALRLLLRSQRKRG